ncbi:MAG: hypothetical protein [Bacteriophage sp.]|nr:MAG: hypothetical protein [Bacteriophage sp.]
MGERVKDVYVMRYMKEVYVMRYMKEVYVMRERVKDVYVMRYMKEVYVMRERGYLSRTSRPRNAFSPPHPLRWKTGNAFSPQTYKLADYQQFI